MKPFLQIANQSLIEHFRDCPAHSFNKGERVFNYSSGLQYLLIIKSGTVRASLLSNKGNERLLYYASIGCLIGDTMLFVESEDICHGLQVIATGPCEVVKVHFNVFLEALVGKPDLLLAALAVAHKKLTIAIEQLEYATFEDTTSQLADLLQALSDASAGADNFIVNMTHQNLADATGRTRVSITNALSRLKNAGFVRLNRGRIEVIGRFARDRGAGSMNPWSASRATDGVAHAQSLRFVR